MTEEPQTPPQSAGNLTRVDVSQSDIRPLARAQLETIQEDAERVATGTGDEMTQAHMVDLAARVRAILENGSDGS